LLLVAGGSGPTTLWLKTNRGRSLVTVDAARKIERVDSREMADYLLDVSTVAEQLQVNYETVRGYCREG